MDFPTETFAKPVGKIPIQQKTLIVIGNHSFEWLVERLGRIVKFSARTNQCKPDWNMFHLVKNKSIRPREAEK